MAEGKITRRSGQKLEITGQQIVSGQYAETINKFDTIIVNEIPEVPQEGQWDISTTNVSSPINVTPGDVTYGITWSPSNHIAVGNEVSPYLYIYKQIDENTWQKVADPDVLPTNTTRALEFSYNGDYLATVNEGTGLIIYKRNGDTFTKINTVTGTLQSNSVDQMSWSGDDIYLAIKQRSGSFDELMAIYKRSGDTFTRLPTTNIPNARGGGSACAFSRDGVYLAQGGGFTSNEVQMLKRSGDVFTELYALLPGTLTVNGDMADWSPDGTYFAVTNSQSSNMLAVHKRNGDTFTRLANPSPYPSARADGGPTFSEDGNYLAVTFRFNSPRVRIYKRNGDTFTGISGVPNLPTDASKIAFSRDFKYLGFSTYSSQKVYIYKTNVTTPTPAYNEILKADNLFTTQANSSDLGYALENGTAGETKNVVSLFRNS